MRCWRPNSCLSHSPPHFASLFHSVRLSLQAPAPAPALLGSLLPGGQRLCPGWLHQHPAQLLPPVQARGPYRSLMKTRVEIISITDFFGGRSHTRIGFDSTGQGLRVALRFLLAVIELMSASMTRTMQVACKCTQWTLKCGWVRQASSSEVSLWNWRCPNSNTKVSAGLETWGPHMCHRHSRWNWPCGRNTGGLWKLTGHPGWQPTMNRDLVYKVTLSKPGRCLPRSPGDQGPADHRTPAELYWETARQYAGTISNQTQNGMQGLWEGNRKTHTKSSWPASCSPKLFDI